MELSSEEVTITNVGRNKKFNLDVTGKSRIISTGAISPPHYSSLSAIHHNSSSPHSGSITIIQPQHIGGLTGKRRVHDEGLSMLDKHYHALR